MQQLWDEMEHIEKPFVVAHHAMCVGGGLEMSLSCDFRLAAKSAGYAFPEGLFGVLPASNGVSRLTRICGPHWARWLIMANKPAPADMAFTMGLVHQVFPDESFEQRGDGFLPPPDQAERRADGRGQSRDRAMRRSRPATWAAMSSAWPTAR